MFSKWEINQKKNWNKSLTGKRARERKGAILPDFMGSLSNIILAITNLIPNKNIKFLNRIIPSSNKVYAHSIFCCLFSGPNILTELFSELFKCNQNCVGFSSTHREWSIECKVVSYFGYLFRTFASETMLKVTTKRKGKREPNEKEARNEIPTIFIHLFAQ